MKRRSALAGACFGVALAVTGCASSGDAGGDRDESRDLTADRRGPLPDGGAASCAESYDPTAVAQRAFAFDGVVVSVGDSVSDRGDEADLGLPGVTFEVREWFSGDGSTTFTVDLQTSPSDSADPGFTYGVGSRLLVSGEARWGGSALESPIAWGCGFSRYYDVETATGWREALAR